MAVAVGVGWKDTLVTFGRWIVRGEETGAV